MPEARTLIVTGASSGIGRELAFAAAREGERVVLVARRAERLERIAAAIGAAGGTCATVVADVTARDAAARIVESAIRHFGRIDVLVNNAGRGAYGALLEQSDAAIEAQWQLNVAAPLRVARAALPHLEASRGHIVFVGSGVARIPLPHGGAYALAKAAIRAAAVQLRRELRPRGIAVTYVDPGVVATEFHSTLRVERQRTIVVSPERVARAILRGIRRRSAVVNAVPWQTAFTALGEWAGTLADAVVIRGFTVRRTKDDASEPVGGVTLSPSTRFARSGPAVSKGDTTGASEASAKDSFEQTLEPVARRMERVKLPADFLRDALIPGTTLELGTLAMRWAGMPNKNERAVLHEALDALAAGGYLERVEEETWRVLRAAQ